MSLIRVCDICGQQKEIFFKCKIKRHSYSFDNCMLDSTSFVRSEICENCLKTIARLSKKRDKAYCQTCGATTSYYTEEYKTTATINDHTFRYDAKKAKCSTCGSEVFVPQIDFANNMTRDDFAYRMGIEKND